MKNERIIKSYKRSWLVKCITFGVLALLSLIIGIIFGANYGNKYLMLLGLIPAIPFTIFSLIFCFAPYYQEKNIGGSELLVVVGGGGASFYIDGERKDRCSWGGKYSIPKYSNKMIGATKDGTLVEIRFSLHKKIDFNIIYSQNKH